MGAIGGRKEQGIEIEGEEERLAKVWVYLQRVSVVIDR